MMMELTFSSIDIIIIQRLLGIQACIAYNMVNRQCL
jgi:hypothetical protein